MKEFFEWYTLVIMFPCLFCLVFADRPRDIVLIPITIYLLPFLFIIIAPFAIVLDMLGFFEELK